MPKHTKPQLLSSQQSASRQKNLWIFFAISLALSIPVFLSTPPDAPVASLLGTFFIGSYIPAILAVIFVSIEKDKKESTAFWARVGALRVGWIWWLFAILFPTVVWLIAGVVFLVQGQDWPASYAALGFFPIALLIYFGEEIGWRGFALPRLLQKYDAVTASLILGAVWGAFHIALNIHRPFFAALNFAFLVAISVILTWLFLRTRSVILTAVLYATFNTWLQVFLIGEKTEMQFMVPLAIIWLVAMYLIYRYGTSLSDGTK
jgi:membrane protease YdiL (CAAX protease family)